MQTMNDDKAAASWFRGFSMGICTGEKGHNELSDEMIDERSEYLKKEKDRHSPRSSMEDQGTPRSSVFPVKYSIGILPPDTRKVDTKNTASRARDDALVSIWKAAPRISRERSSKVQLRKAYDALSPKPNVEDVLRSLSAWSMSDKWSKDDGQYQEAIHRWIQNRKFEDVPEAKPDFYQDAQAQSERVAKLLDQKFSGGNQ